MSEPRRIDTGRSPYGWSTLQWIGVCDLRGALSSNAHLSDEERLTRRYDVPARDPALIFGTLLHTGLAHFFARAAIRRNGSVLAGDLVETDAEALMRPLPAMRDIAQEADAALWERGLAPAWQPELARAEECLRAYAAQRGPDDIDVIAVESLSTRTIPDGKGGSFEFTQRRDFVFRDHGLIFVGDTKTTASSASAFPGKVLDYTMHGQLIAMDKAGRLEWGDRFGGVVVNLVQSIPPYRSKLLNLLSAPRAVATIDRNLGDRHNRLQALRRTRPDPFDWPTAIHEQVCRGRYGAAGDSAIERGLCPHYHECRLGGVARDPGTG